MSSIVYIVTKYAGPRGPGEIMGVFSTQERADAFAAPRCLCVMPEELDVELPNEGFYPSNCYYPHYQHSCGKRGAVLFD